MLKFVKRHWLLIISLIYFVWPLDLISDFFGPIGLIDDGAVLLAAVLRELYLYHQERKRAQEIIDQAKQLPAPEPEQTKA